MVCSVDLGHMIPHKKYLFLPIPAIIVSFGHSQDLTQTPRGVDCNELLNGHKTTKPTMVGFVGIIYLLNSSSNARLIAIRMSSASVSPMPSAVDVQTTSWVCAERN